MKETNKKINNEERYEKVLSEKDIFAIAFGAMIGWGWVNTSWLLDKRSRLYRSYDCLCNCRYDDNL